MSCFFFDHWSFRVSHPRVASRGVRMNAIDSRARCVRTSQIFPLTRQETQIIRQENHLITTRQENRSQSLHCESNTKLSHQTQTNAPRNAPFSDFALVPKCTLLRQRVLKIWTVDLNTPTHSAGRPLLSNSSSAPFRNLSTTLYQTANHVF